MRPLVVLEAAVVTGWLALAGVGIASLLAFIAVETRTARPMFDFGAFRARA